MDVRLTSKNVCCRAQKSCFCVAWKVIIFAAWCSSPGLSDVTAVQLSSYSCLFFRWESHRPERGPQTGAEGAGGRVRLSAEAGGSVPHQRQDFLDSESNAWLLELTSSMRRTFVHHIPLALKPPPTTKWRRQPSLPSITHADFVLPTSFPGCPSVPLHSGLPCILPDNRQPLVGAGCGSRVWPQPDFSWSARQHRVRGQDTPLLQWAAGPWQPHGCAAYAWGGWEMFVSYTSLQCKNMHYCFKKMCSDKSHFLAGECIRRINPSHVWAVIINLPASVNKKSPCLLSYF